MTGALSVLRRVLREEAGLAWDPHDLEAARTRLAPVLRAAGLDGLPALAARVSAGDAALCRRVVEAMVTHETSFFRDRAAFGFIEATILPELRARAAGRRHLRIWSAACATGQEPFSVAMMLEEHARAFEGWTVEILATDFSGQAIATARAGRYDHFEVQRGLSTGRLLRHFSRVGAQWEIAPSLRARVRFERFNLLADYAALGPFDLVLCRNVLLYFDDATASGVLSRIAALLPDGGFCMLGTSEAMPGLAPDFRPDPRQPGALRRTGRE